MFGAEESAIQELIAGVKQGYLVQAHTHEVDECGCPCTVPSIVEWRPALFFLGHISPIFAPFFLVFSRFSPS